MTPAPVRLTPVDFDPFSGPAISHVYASTEAQREIFAAADWGTGASCAFNESWSLALEGLLDVVALQKAVDNLVARHEALRSVLSPDGSTVLVFGSLTANLSRPTATLAEHLAREVETPFDLVLGPLFRVALFSESATRHVFVFTAHHLICDGWSAAILVKDLGLLYSAAKAGLTAELKPAAKLSEYSAWEEKRALSPEARADETYWLSQYTAGVPVLDLPLTRSRPKVKTYTSRRADVEIPIALLDALKKVGAQERASLFTVLISGFYVWLARLTGQESFVVGVPAAGQSVKGETTLVGHCVNLLPIHVAVPLGQPFTQLLGEVRAKVLDAFDHQQFTYGSLLKKLPIGRDPGRSPLVAVMFNLDQGLSEAELAYDGLKPAFVTTPRHFENFELFLNVTQISSMTTLECQYSTDLFGESEIRSYLESYVRILESIAAAPGTAVGSLALLTEDSKRRLVEDFNRTATPGEKPVSLVALFEAQAAKSARSPAVTGSGRTFTYADLNARANHLAKRLRDHAIRPGETVGIAMERTPELLVGLLGIMKVGAAYVPIDPTYPEARLQAMFEDSRLRLLVSTADIARKLPPHQANVVLLDEGRVDANPAPPEGTRDLTAYVIFTSGSTGRPKGVAVPQGAVANFLASMKKSPGMVAGDVLLAVTTISFDIHCLELFLPLVSGARLVLATKDEAGDGMRLKDLITQNQITVLQATPATWRMLLDAGWIGNKALKALCGGEPLPGELAARLLPQVRALWNMYGPTETTVWSTCFEVKDPRAKILVGRPIDNTTCFVVDQQLNLEPAGVAGELLIGGLGVTKGYVGRDDLTAERFVPDPFSGKGLLYRTGDLARFHPDGQLECLGRTDTQVKLRGFRIELGEIETALAHHPAVAVAVAGVRERAPGDPRLVAWYVEKQGASVTAWDLRQSLLGSLPEYMVPQLFLSVAELPLTPNGKVDRRYLPSPFAAESTVERPKIKRARIVRRAVVPKSQKVTPLQKRLLDYERRTPGTALYNLPTGFRLMGSLDVPALERAIKEFGQRHEMLRTRFVRSGSDWLQEANDDAAPRLSIHDLTGRDPGDREAFLKQEFQSIAERPFDLTRAPLFQIAIYQLSDAENVLFIMAHHAVWDGWSFDIFVKELSALYEAFVAGKSSPLTPTPVSYGDFAAWYDAEQTRGSFQDLDTYWKKQLADSPPPPVLPMAKPRPAHPSGRGRSTSYTMPRDLANALTAVGRESGATLFMVLLAAYKVLIHRLASTNDVAVLTPVRGRGEAELEGIIGCFVNQIALRSRIRPEDSFAVFLKQCRQTSLEGMNHDDLPFDMVADQTRACISFSFQDARERPTNFGKIPYKQINIEPAACDVDLNFWVKESHESLTGSMNYATDLFDEAAIRELLSAYNALLYAIVRDPATTLAELATSLHDLRIAPVKSWFENVERIEAEAHRHPDVSGAAVIVLPGTGQEPRLALHFKLKPGRTLTPSDLRHHVRASVGEGLCPSIVAEAESLDKQALAASYHVPATEDGANAAPPVTKAEKVLARIWGELLGLPVKNKRSNFFEVGGHSLLAIQMLARIEKETGAKVTRMAVTLNTLEQIAQTMGLDTTPEAAPADAKDAMAVPTNAMVPVYFGRSEARLFGVHYPPKARPSRGSGVLLCYPGPEEYMRVHWAFRNLTQALTKAGFHVFKFDYFGTGDSAGALGEGDAATWRNDIATAAEEFRAMAAVKRLSVVGARLGAALAATLADAGPLDELVLWDPVVSGKHYVDELRALQRRRLANSRYPLEKLLSKEVPELLGYPFRPAIEQSLQRLDLTAVRLVPSQHTTLVTSEPHDDYERLAAKLAGKDFARHDVDDPCRWRTQELLEQAILPVKIVQKIVEIVTGVP